MSYLKTKKTNHGIYSKKSVLKAALTHAKKVTQATTSKMSTTVNKFKSKKPPIGIIKEKKKHNTSTTDKG